MEASFSSTFSFGGRTIHVPPPAYPAGAAAFEHQRAMGLDVLQPIRAAASADDQIRSMGLNAAFLPAATAFRVWPCAKALGEWLHESPAAPKLIGLSVLELGAGCGLAGFAASLAGAAAVCLTELPENLPRLRELIAANACSVVSAEPLDWTQPLPPSIAAKRWDVILASDCVFWPGLFEPLLRTLAGLHAAARARAEPPPRAFLSMTDRLGRARQFAAAARERGWVLDELQPCQPAGSRAPPAHSLEALRREACELYELRSAH